MELVGPFSVRDGEDNYQLYLIRPVSSSQSDFINLLFDRPLLLLIVTMLVSTPLLLWLAWSLAKPARKLKTLPMKLPRKLTPAPGTGSGATGIPCRRCQF